MIYTLTLFAGSFVAVLDSGKDRNDTAEIKSRIKRVSIVTLLCVGYCTLISGYSLYEMGISTVNFFKSISISLGLSFLLFLGPMATNSWQHEFDNTWITIRNLIAVIYDIHLRVLSLRK